MKLPPLTDTLINGNRIVEAPPPTPGLRNTVHSVLVGEGWEVEWTWEHIGKGKRVIGHTLTKKGATLIPNEIYTDEICTRCKKS